ncbi:unnamed protein product [Ectocarpus sp. 12 AP-2014]
MLPAKKKARRGSGKKTEASTVCPSKRLRAFRAILGDTSDGKHWFSSTKQLQLASVHFCVECRNVRRQHLRVDDDTPGWLLGAAGVPLRAADRTFRSRVPRLRAREVTWKRSSAALLKKPLFALAEAESMTFGWRFDDGPEAVIWPRRLGKVVLGERLYHAINCISWPESLRRLTLGCDFNQPIAGIRWPASLKQLTLCGFNQSVQCVQWPPSLQQLTFGLFFNQPIDADVTWPESLQQLTLGTDFNQGIVGVTWPASLQRLRFGNKFDREIEGVEWPASLQHLTFGKNFNRTIESVAWPSTLRKLTFGLRFNRALGSVACPSSLTHLTLGRKFNQPLHAIRTWVPGLVELVLLFERRRYSHSLSGVQWPTGLQTLTLRKSWEADGLALPRGLRLIYLTP